MDIREMKAGRELDALVAEKVMGQYFRNEWYKLYNDTIPCYSTDISAAWKVVEKIKKEFVGISDPLNCNIWECSFTFKTSALGETAPLAICRAALLAMEES